MHIIPGQLLPTFQKLLFASLRRLMVAAFSPNFIEDIDIYQHQTEDIVHLFFVLDKKGFADYMVHDHNDEVAGYLIAAVLVIEHKAVKGKKIFTVQLVSQHSNHRR